MITTDIFKGKIHNSWLPIFQSEVGEAYIKTLNEIVKTYNKKDNMGFSISKLSGLRLLPRLQEILHPFRCVDLDNIRVVIIFEQPANNIFCTGIPIKSSYCDYTLNDDMRLIIGDAYYLYSHINKSCIGGPINVDRWMEEGVLLINAAMTREINNNNNHVHYWNYFSSLLVNSIYQYNKECLFVVVGNNIHDITCNLPKEAHIIYTPQGICKTEKERATFHKSNFFKTIDDHMSNYDHNVLINW